MGNKESTIKGQGGGIYSDYAYFDVWSDMRVKRAGANVSHRRNNQNIAAVTPRAILSNMRVNLISMYI